MFREKMTASFKLLTVLAGCLIFIFSLSNTKTAVLDWRFVSFLVLSLLISAKISFPIRGTNQTLSFSDSSIFLAFLLLGGYEAVIFAAIDVAVTCVILKRRGTVFSKYAVGFNIASNTISTALTFVVWQKFQEFRLLEPSGESTASLIANLGVLAIVQFIFVASFASLYYSITHNVTLREAWRRGGMSVPITQISGAIAAGVAYKLIKNSDFVTTFIACLVLVVGYLNYKKVIKDMTASMETAEKAQIEKAESERIKAEQAEIHAIQLQEALDEQEKVSVSLQIANDALEHSAYYDPLTDLPNRAYLIERLSLLLKLRIEVQHKYYIFFLDIRRFKDVNNRLGHEIGDRLLCLVGKRLGRIVKADDTIVRIGGDEFAIILCDLKSPEEAAKYARTITKKLAQPFSVQGHKIFISLNIGISAFEDEHRKAEDILRDADIAMHYAKQKESAFAFFDTGLRTRVLEKIKLESFLRFAVERNQLEMHYQPLISLKDGEIIGFEALIRWYHPQLGLISPNEFIPIAEESGLIIPITEWVLSETTKQLSEWQKISSEYENLIVSVNISGKHISQNGLVAAVDSSLKHSGIDPAALKLEITESTAMEDAERTIKVLTELKKLGVQLSIDDFGTGYSSLSYLHSLPFDTLKVDRSFVYSVGVNGENSEVLQTIISLAQNLKMRVIAEGIETKEQLQLLQSLGCDFGQGFYMAKPLPRDEIETLLYKKRIWFPESFHANESNSNHSERISGEVIYSTKVSH